MTEEDEEFGRIERETKQRTEHETMVYKIAGVTLEGGFYAIDELRQILKSIDNMNTTMIERRK